MVKHVKYRCQPPINFERNVSLMSHVLTSRNWNLHCEMPPLTVFFSFFVATDMIKYKWMRICFWLLQSIEFVSLSFSLSVYLCVSVCLSAAHCSYHVSRCKPYKELAVKSQKAELATMKRFKRFCLVISHCTVYSHCQCVTFWGLSSLVDYDDLVIF